MNLDGLDLFDQWELLECNCHQPSVAYVGWQVKHTWLSKFIVWEGWFLVIGLVGHWVFKARWSRQGHLGFKSLRVKGILVGQREGLTFNFPCLWNVCFEFISPMLIVEFLWISFEVKMGFVYRVLKHVRWAPTRERRGTNNPVEFLNHKNWGNWCTKNCHVSYLEKDLLPIKFT